MTPTKKCPLCETTLEYAGDRLRVRFTAHDDAFCRGATMERLRQLQRALQHAGEDLAQAKAHAAAIAERAHVERRVLRDALSQALEQWSSVSKSPDIERIERIVADESHFEELVGVELRVARDVAAQIDAMNRRMAAAGALPAEALKSMFGPPAQPRSSEITTPAVTDEQAVMEDVRFTSVSGHAFCVTATDEIGFHTGRRRYRVECLTCGDLVHEATTGVRDNVLRHVRESSAEIDQDQERQRFHAQVGESVEAWLARWRSGAISKTGRTFALSYWAALLERR